MDVDEKRAVVERLTTRIRESETMIVTDYRGLSVTQMAEVRAQLREAGATFQITKNTLARIAAAEAEKPDLVEFLEGQTAIAFGCRPTRSASSARFRPVTCSARRSWARSLGRFRAPTTFLPHRCGSSWRCSTSTSRSARPKRPEPRSAI